MKTKRFFASLLALVLLLSCVNLTALAADNNPNTDGLKLSKMATPVDGGYKIRLEAYTTGKVTTHTTGSPVDVVLVLDQSGSMQYSFKNTTRQAAMKNAVNNFIDAIAEKYSDTFDHRISIVTFGSSASTLQGWTPVDAGGKNTLKNKVSGLPSDPNGATNAGDGMVKASELMGNGYNYQGTNNTRQKVVVFFTDGVPTTGTRFDVGTANKALNAAQAMKKGGVTIYSVGIFGGAKPSELHGDCDGKVGSKWGKTRFLWADDVADVDQPAGNRFLNYISNNFMSASEIGLKSADWWFIVQYTGWEITKNFDRTQSGYYLTATDSSELNNIFQSITENIQTAAIDLDSTTVVKDVVSDYFDLPANTNDIKVYTAPYQGNGKWGADVISTLKPTVVGKNVAVTGFDFNENYIMEADENVGPKGNKLILEFTVTARDGFLGGNGVPTNGADSGVYTADGGQVKTFEVPTVDVPIPDFTVTAEDKNVYLMGELKDEDFTGGVKAMYGNVNLLDTNAFTGENAWKAEFVEIQTAITKPQASELTEDKTYSAAVTVKPREQGTIQDKVVTGSGNINVFKPELTFKDLEGYYGAEVPAFTENPTETVWKHNDKVSTDEGITMIGNEPTLDITCTPDSTKVSNGKINTKQDIPVKAEVKIDTVDVTTHTKFVHQNCTSDCNWATPVNPGDPAFLIHVETCQLTVKKSGGVQGESYVFTVYKDNQPYSQVTIEGTVPQTIVELPVGEYTIREDTGWSWRYTANNGTAATLSADTPAGEITCTNTNKNNKWLNGFSEVVRNIFAPVIIS